LRVLLALIMETRRGTEESPRGLCEISSSIKSVNETKRGEQRIRVINRRREGRREEYSMTLGVRLD